MSLYAVEAGCGLCMQCVSLQIEATTTSGMAKRMTHVGHVQVVCLGADLHRVINGDVSPIREGIPFNFKRGSVVQGYAFTFMLHFSALDTIHWRKEHNKIILFSPAWKPYSFQIVYIGHVPHAEFLSV